MGRHAYPGAVRVPVPGQPDETVSPGVSCAGGATIADGPVGTGQTAWRAGSPRRCRRTRSLGAIGRSPAPVLAAMLVACAGRQPSEGYMPFRNDATPELEARSTCQERAKFRDGRGLARVNSTRNTGRGSRPLGRRMRTVSIAPSMTSPSRWSAPWQLTWGWLGREDSNLRIRDPHPRGRPLRSAAVHERRRPLQPTRAQARA